MNDDGAAGFDPRLVDLHLGALGDSERAALSAQLASDASLRREQEALASAFAALASLRNEPAPAGLADRIVAAVRGSRLRVHRGGAPAAQPDNRLRRVFRLGGLRDLVAVAALLVFAIGVGVPGILQVRQRNQRILCSANLMQVGQGLQQYASTFGNSLPFAGWSARNSWLPTRDGSLQPQPNRKHVYPLLRLALVGDPRRLICPARADVAMPADQVSRHDDFLEARNISYAYFNMAGARPSLTDAPDLPILADDNPLFEDGVPLLEALRRTAGDADSFNSRAHAGVGQNIVTLDGRVKFVKFADCGIGGDNIWTLRGVAEYTGREGPASAQDAHLIK